MNEDKGQEKVNSSRVLSQESTEDAAKKQTSSIYDLLGITDQKTEPQEEENTATKPVDDTGTKATEDRKDGGDEPSAGSDESAEAAPRPGDVIETDDSKVYLLAVEHLNDLMADILAGKVYDFTPIVQDAFNIGVSIMRSNYLQIRAMGKRIEGPSFAPHSVNVAIFAVKLALGLKYSPELLVEVALSGLVHDVGMLLLPEEIREATRKLTDEEFNELRSHPSIGSQYLKKAIESQPVLSAYSFLPVVTLHEHERIDGTGYPNGLSGEQIHEYSRIISIVDSYEAISHQASYREGFLAYEALQKVIAMKETHFDVKMIRALVREISVFPVQSYVKLNNGEIGRVTKSNLSHPMRPVMSIIIGSDGNPVQEERELDLVQSPFLFIESPVYEEDMPQLGLGRSSGESAGNQR